jgi:NAD(P)-dependent dehydrogenase (short-subunit alcohol dehydrogenase family)
MKIDLSGKMALVTGSTAGIGLTMAKGVATAGTSVIVNGRSQASVDRGVAATKGAAPGSDVKGVPADLSSVDGCSKLIAVGNVDILVNNTGIFDTKDLFEIPDADWTRFFEVNVMSGVRLSRALMRRMLERDWGRIIFIASESGVNTP